VKTETSTMFVSSDFFRAIGVTLVQGPGFDAKRDGAFTAEPVVIVGYRFWQNRLGTDRDIVGKTLTLDGTPHVVVGIAPDQFDGIDTKELIGSARTASASPSWQERRQQRSCRPGSEVGAHPRPPVAGAGLAQASAAFWRHIAAGQTVPGHHHCL
jgi:MacB-like protein